VSAILNFEVPCDPAPNVITINGDQHNDYIDFTFYFGNFDEIIIYNRWGGVVSTHTPTNSVWHGLDDNGRRVSEGVYYYGVTKNGVGNSYYLHVFHD
jgi:gliding motility-associated-like protein